MKTFYIISLSFLLVGHVFAQPATVSITGETPGSGTWSAPVNLGVHFTATASMTVTYYLDGSQVGSANVLSGSNVWNVTIQSPGTHTLQINAPQNHASVSYVINAHPHILFTTADSAATATKYNTNSFPFNNLKNVVIGTQVPLRGSLSQADYDRSLASAAKEFAFQYYFNRTQSNSSNALQCLWTLNHAENYTIDQSYAYWMTNGLALIDYCIAYDILAGAGYFNNDPTDRTNIVNTLNARAQALYGQVGSDLTIGTYLNTTGSVCTDYVVLGIPQLGIRWTIKVCVDEPTYAVTQQALFRSQNGNMRIIVGAALGVAYYALLNEGSNSLSSAYLSFAQNDVGEFLLNRSEPNYPTVYDLNGTAYNIQSQNVAGAFPEGIEYFNYSGQGFVPFFIANKKNGGEDYSLDAQFQNILNWTCDVQLPNGSAPQINSTGFNIDPLSVCIWSNA